MAQVYTPSFVNNLQSSSYTQFEYNQDLQPLKKPTDSVYNDYFFQILLCEDTNTPPKLVYGKKENLISYYGLDNSAFPSSGVEMDRKFILSGGVDALTYSTGAMTHWLLQTRKISQLIAYTWLNPENIAENSVDEANTVSKQQVEYARKILSYPMMDTIPYYVKKNQSGELEEKEFGDGNYIDDLANELPGIKLYAGSKAENSSLLIKPGHENYRYLPLALLLCGQAFYKFENDGYQQLWEPIANMPQLIVELGLSVTWDTFYGTISDRSSGGATNQYPYKTASIPYPPRPNEFNLTQEQIKAWATADDHASDGEEYPFYPSEDDPDWEDHRTQFVNPPNPYIPLSCI